MNGAPDRIALMLFAAIAMPAAASADCRMVTKDLRKALLARDLPAARSHYEAVVAEPACGGGVRDRARRAVSALHARTAQERIAAGETVSSLRRLLERGLSYGRSWPLLALLGDEAAVRRDHVAASALYQEALTAIDDEIRTPRPPPAAEIERIFDSASRSRMLAKEHRPAPRTRSGAPGGLAAERIRGFVIKKVPVPIGFHTDSARFTERGRLAAAELAEHLKAQRPARIAIAGHTDPRGTAAYNMALSRKRAEAVARYLRAKGFLGEIAVIAKGESERFPVQDPSAWTEEERWRMDRRVELIR